MTRVEVSEAASADLDAIYDYGVEQFGAAAAEAYLRRFESAYALLAEHPQIGPVHDWVRPPIRSFPCGRHRLYYDVTDDAVIIRRVLHQAMDVQRHL
ncbi:type II toxin-antitoxin system RelE/ParE family toxin [Sphingomonas sp.]|uniref:type II toxin-antitoxin system RelE/ParE family toxin n=1 Tax=Sphingomonas sp. TaxID=28214 RepID=UPI002D8087F6|nr:type II toxin-antitoxin system RelE/ParE family toxin [Sphingomonas sp.]HEU0045319.1 type II toxin-antitoxin system RelE/ParE family toxin [Sphingomonas sp.]